MPLHYRTKSWAKGRCTTRSLQTGFSISFNRIEKEINLLKPDQYEKSK